MAALKWAVVALCSLGALGSLAMGFTSQRSRTHLAASQPVIALRPFPGGSIGGAAPAVAAKTPEPVAAKTPEPVAAKTPEPVGAKTPEPVAAKTPEPVAVKTPEPVAAKTPEPVAAKTPEPVAAKTPEPVAAKTPEPVAAKTPPAQPAPAPVAKAPAPVAAAPVEGSINLRASDTADVYLDGKKIGGSPLLGVKAKAGNHKVRFDCYDAAGNTIAGPVQTVSVKADAEVEVEFTCPSE